MNAAVYHSVANTVGKYYSISTSSGGATETDALVAWMPRACTATRLDVFSKQSGSIQVTLRSGPYGSLSDTVLTCTPSGSPNTCSVTGTVAVAAGSFLDLRIDYSSGTAAPVWTAVECN